MLICQKIPLAIGKNTFHVTYNGFTFQLDRKSMTEPASEDFTIWRYMEFAKFIAVLETQSLFFARVAHLEDRFEGSFPLSQPPSRRIVEMLPKELFLNGAEISIAPSQGLEDHWKAMRNWAMVNCWHAMPFESVAMWKLYAPSGLGVVVRSTVLGLGQALGTPPPVQPGFFGADQYRIQRIKYIDFRSCHIPIQDGAAQFFCKDQSFQHECEVRALLMRWPVRTDRWFDHDMKPDDAGQEFPVEVGNLIQEVRVSPQAPRWYLELVRKIVSRYGLQIQTEPSELDATPFY